MTSKKVDPCNQQECYDSTKEHLTRLIKEWREAELDALKGKAWICRAEYYDGECATQAPSCMDCLQVPFNFAAYVLIIP